MTLSDLLGRLRRRLNDLAEPSLWSRQDLVSFLNEAEVEAADRARLLYDESSEVTRITVQAGIAHYPLDNRVFDVDRVRLNGRRLDRSNKLEMDRTACRDWESDTGTPSHFIEEVNSLQLYPIPTADGVLSLSLWRGPLEPMESNDSEPEIQVNHHARLMDWALSVAYRNRDSDAEDIERADKYEAAFTASFGERQDADIQRQQKIKRVPIVRPRF